MEGKWLVTKNPMMDRPYGLYRLRDVTETDHSGNREYQATWYSAPHDAAVAADELNGKTEVVEMSSELTVMEFLKRKRELCQLFDHCGTCPMYLTCWRVEDLSDEELEEQIKIFSEWVSNQPFVPEMGESYWAVDYSSVPEGDKMVFCSKFGGGLFEYLMAINGLCYRTEAAALAHAEEDLARLQDLYDDMRTEGLK